MISEDTRLCTSARDLWPGDPPDPIEWGEEHVQFPGSARSRRFNISVTPWLREPIYRAAQGLWIPPADFYLDTSVESRITTLMKPVQSGGSSFGELLILYWIVFGRGILQYNWTDDDKAADRWESRVEGILKACDVVKAMMDALAEDECNKCEIDFGNVFFKMQGAFNPNNLDSDSVPLQVNEEVHAWKPGHLKKARNRSTAVWNFKSVDVSNAGKVGSQLDQAFKDGTAQHWEVKCPGCSNPHHAANSVFHRMRTKWDSRRPEHGGLRYDADGARRKDSTYDYNKIRSTVRFQMPCGYAVHDEPMQRRALSLGGRYCEPTNTGADLTHRSYTYQAVTVDYIDWMKIIKDKHDALFARRYGDMEPWNKYVTEVECLSYDPDDVPIIGAITLVTGGKKNRDGLTGEKLRLGMMDRQQGDRSKGEMPHWWCLIRDYQIIDGVIRSLLVHESKQETDEGAADVMKSHTVNPWQVVVDSGDDTTHVYTFCFQHGFNAIKGGKEDLYVHPGGARRIFSPERPLHPMVGRGPKYPMIPAGEKSINDPREPMFWLYSKPGIRERLHWLRTNTHFETPEDVSEDYQQHMESEERITTRHPLSGEEIHKWIQQKTRNDQFVNEGYGAMQVDMAGWIGATAVTKKKEGK